MGPRDLLAWSREDGATANFPARAPVAHCKDACCTDGTTANFLIRVPMANCKDAAAADGVTDVSVAGCEDPTAANFLAGPW